MAGKSGRIVTFYSVKGGTGRTTAVSNIAWILASNGCRVLLIDWDLEAPGLHRYLRPFLDDAELTQTSGLLDFLSNAMQRGGGKAGRRPLADYAAGLNWTYSGNGAIALIPAGRQGEEYAKKLYALDLDRFYREAGGAKMLRAESDALRAEYDYILIDSRAGISESANICAVQLPDALVFLFTLNEPSIDRAVDRARDIRRERADLPIFPVPALVENREADKLAAAIKYARSGFAPFLLHVQHDRTAIDPAQQAPYWRDVETPYVSFYAFEQVPAAFAEEPGSRQGLLASYERISYWITGGEVAKLRPDSEERRKSVVEAYQFNQGVSGKLVPPPPQLREDQERGWIVGRVRGVMGQALASYGWKYATVVLAIVVAIGTWRVISESQTPSSQIGAAASQLIQVADDLMAVVDELYRLEASVAKSGDGTTWIKPELANASERLADARRRLNDVLAGPQSTMKDRPPKPAPPAQRRN
jgi:MinD-like ATPase involved in chromosome partitioning or flagellar assembly